MTTHPSVKYLAIVMVVLCAGYALAQAPTATPPTTSAYLIPIGTPVNLDTAKKAATAALAEARKNGWLMVAAVVQPDGTLVYYERMDNVQVGSTEVALDKARSAALYKRPTKVFQDAVEKGGINLRVFALKGAVPVDGGYPLVVDGKLIGAIGLSGDLSENDAKCAKAGVAAVTTP